ncbi:hypothetical protein HDU93_002763 [Gonapodya sp. JEL0774]|nr:hypothetical protein HDU93_002763 [Gonapodya sp. JEL0774]
MTATAVVDPAALLIEAVEAGDLPLLQALLEAGVDPNSRKVVRIRWLKKGAGSGEDVEESAECESALALAMRDGRTDMVDILLGADSHDVNTPISWRVPAMTAGLSNPSGLAEAPWLRNPNWRFHSPLDLALTHWTESSPTEERLWNAPGGVVVVDYGNGVSPEPIPRTLKPDAEIVKRLLLHGVRVTKFSLERAQRLAAGEDGFGLTCSPQPEFLSILKAQTANDRTFDKKMNSIPPIIPLPLPLLAVELGVGDAWVEDPLSAFSFSPTEFTSLGSPSDSGTATVVRSTALAADSDFNTSVTLLSTLTSLPESGSSPRRNGSTLSILPSQERVAALQIANNNLVEQLTVAQRELGDVREKVRALFVGNGKSSEGSPTVSLSTELPTVTALRRHHALLSRQYSRTSKLATGMRDYVAGSCNIVHAGHSHTRREADEVDLRPGDALGVNARLGDGWGSVSSQPGLSAVTVDLLSNEHSTHQGINYTTLSQGTFPLGCVTERPTASPPRYRNIVPPRTLSRPPPKPTSDVRTPTATRYYMKESPGTWASSSDGSPSPPGTFAGRSQQGHSAPRRVVRYSLGSGSGSGRAVSEAPSSGTDAGASAA